MVFKVLINLLFIILIAGVPGRSQQRFDKSTFYSVMQSGKINDIDAQLNILKGYIIGDKEAFEGALLMKKAAMVSRAKEKLSLFKSGRSKLELSISKANDNAEYRFLRLIIQEHAPKIVKYRNQLEEDSEMIRTNFKSLSPLLQQEIIAYSKKSKVLKNP